jgi:hypothetical protein
MRTARILRSNGEPAARAHAIATVPPPAAMPLGETERVEITDPRRTPTLRDDRPRGPGPRDPDQKEWRAPKPPSVELPDGRPIMKAQRIYIDDELLEQWAAEARAAATRQGTP